MSGPPCRPWRATAWPGRAERKGAWGPCRGPHVDHGAPRLGRAAPNVRGVWGPFRGPHVYMAGEYAFVMKDLRKVVPPKREILRGIYLSFFHGAKIGVLGANGAGKSSLLRIMAGVDKDFLGEAFAADGLRIGYLPQEPQLDSTKDVRGNVEEGVAETRAILTRFEEVPATLGEPLSDTEMEKLREEQARLQERIDAANAWDLDRTVEMAMDALRVPPGDADVATISGGERRRVALYRLLLARPDMLLLDEPTNHLDAEPVAWLERFLAEC